MAALAGLILFIYAAQAVAGMRGLGAVFSVLMCTALFAGLCCRKIGGVTGDTLGAACELAETAVALIVAFRTEYLL
jgi:adenosylcobinamide-GDP ribazoletransferase